MSNTITIKNCKVVNEGQITEKDLIIKNGRFLPALIKSSAVFVFLEKYSPMRTDNRIYKKIKLSTIIKKDDKGNKNTNYQQIKNSICFNPIF